VIIYFDLTEIIAVVLRQV